MRLRSSPGIFAKSEDASVLAAVAASVLFWAAEGEIAGSLFDEALTAWKGAERVSVSSEATRALVSRLGTVELDLSHIVVMSAMLI